MRTVFLALAVALQGVTSAPANAQTPSAVQVQSALAELGRWSQDYQAIVAEGVAVVAAFEELERILDRFVAGETSLVETQRAIGSWRDTARERLVPVRARADALRRPPSLAILGAEGVSLDTATAASHASLPRLVDEIGVLLDSLAELSLSALEDKEATVVARGGVLLRSAIQLLRIDTNRVVVAATSVPADHPNRRLLQAGIAHMGALQSLLQSQLDVLEGRGGDGTALAISLRRAATDIRARVAESEALLERTRASMSEMPQGHDLTRLLTRLLDTYPESYRAYLGLADGLEAAGGAIESGAEPVDAMTALDAASQSHYETLMRLDAERARLVAGAGGESL